MPDTSSSKKSVSRIKSSRSSRVKKGADQMREKYGTKDGLAARDKTYSPVSQESMAKQISYVTSDSSAESEQMRKDSLPNPSTQNEKTSDKSPSSPLKQTEARQTSPSVKVVQFTPSAIADDFSGDKSHKKSSVVFTEQIEGASLAWKDINMYVNVSSAKCCGKERKQLLSNVSGFIGKGEVTALMGPSGSGKTTLLDVLADRVRRAEITGKILINGKPRDNKKFRFICSYLSVSDQFYEVFTVRETMLFAAALILPKSSKDERRFKVERLIRECGMGSCAATKIGGEVFRGISTGQRRRLSIAMELLKSPLLLFMDEPLSGLDGSAAVNIMENIQALAQAGMTILMSVHQPPSAVWNMFTGVTLLTNGVVMYSGGCEAGLQFMEKTTGTKCPKFSNPPDYFLNLINSDFEGHADINKIAQDYNSSLEKMEILDRIEQAERGGRGVDECFIRPRCNYCTQFALLTARTLKNAFLHPGMFWYRLLDYVVLNVIVGTMFLRTNDTIDEQDKVLLLFFVLSYVVILSTSCIPILINLRPVFLKERANGVIDTGPYVVATFIGMLPAVLIITTVTSIMIVFMTDIKGFGVFFVTTFLVLLISESLMYTSSTFTDDHVTATAIASGLFGTFMICCGFLLPKSRIPGYWIWMYYLAYHTYAFRAYMDGHLKSADNKTQAAMLLAHYDMENVDLGLELGILCVYVVVLMIIFTIVIQFKHTGRK